MFVQVSSNRLEGELKTIDDLQIKLLNNNRDLLIAVHDKKASRSGMYRYWQIKEKCAMTKRTRHFD
ncbi:hypothetical protein [Paraflavitalea speifideaquila]|uniref:hypothetical protein n=1 Tax=Paraflavitalea speifideaquila TaxID=3076558 RepID=UPI0028EAF81E|nr:hypothetical protein [Paraflavitalea speifideiaquila]